MANGKAAARGLLIAVLCAASALAAKPPEQPKQPKLQLEELVPLIGNQPVGDPGFIKLVMQAYVCSALAARNDNVCMGLDNFGDDAGISCRWNAIEAAYLALPPIPELDAGCRQTVTAWGAGDFVRKGEEAAFCSAWSAALRTRQAGAVCGQGSRFAPGGKGGEFSDGCRQMLAFLAGPQACARVTDDTAAPTCRDFAFLAKAGPARDAKLCGRSLLCEATVTGSPAPCEKLKRQAVQTFMDSELLTEGMSSLRDEIQLRLSYGVPISGAAHGTIRDLIEKEKKFRAEHGYPALEPGDPFLSTLTPGQIRSYLKSRGKSPEEGGPEPEGQ